METEGGMSTYKNAFHDTDGQKYGPPEYTTDAKGVEYRGFTIYPRIKNNRHGYGGCADTVIGGWCIQQTVTVEGAKGRIDDLLEPKEGWMEERARELMKKHGIPMPGEFFAA